MEMVLVAVVVSVLIVLAFYFGLKFFGDRAFDIDRMEMDNDVTPVPQEFTRDMQVPNERRR